MSSAVTRGRVAVGGRTGPARHRQSHRGVRAAGSSRAADSGTWNGRAPCVAVVGAHPRHDRRHVPTGSGLRPTSVDAGWPSRSLASPRTLRSRRRAFPSDAEISASRSSAGCCPAPAADRREYCRRLGIGEIPGAEKRSAPSEHLRSIPELGTQARIVGQRGKRRHDHERAVGVANVRLGRDERRMPVAGSAFTGRRQAAHPAS